MMEKAIVTMTNWSLSGCHGKYNLAGTADNHPTLGKNTYVWRTSELVTGQVEDDVLIYETRNTIYRCPLKYMHPQPYQNTEPWRLEELLRAVSFSEAPLEKIIAAAIRLALKKDDLDSYAKHIKTLVRDGQAEIEELLEMENERLISMAMRYEDCIYLEVSSVTAGDKLAYHLGDCVGIVQPRLHKGTVQDSILYMKYAGIDEGEDDGCALDFRYYPKGFEDEMESYSWSENIKQAVIKNVTEYRIMFNKEKIDPGKTRVFVL